MSGAEDPKPCRFLFQRRNAGEHPELLGPRIRSKARGITESGEICVALLLQVATGRGKIITAASYRSGSRWI